VIIRISPGNYNLTATGITTLDSDNLSDALELMIGSSRFSNDTDGDGVLDFDEVNYAGDAASFNPATDLNPLLVDTDGDVIDDATELLNGTNPLDPNDFFLLGDLNSDAQVTLADYPQLQFVLETNGATPQTGDVQAGDMNQNNQIDTGDLVIHLRTVLELN